LEPGDHTHRVFWEKWLVQNPHRLAEIEEARHLVEMLTDSGEVENLREAEKQELWAQIQSTISNGKTIARPAFLNRFAGSIVWRSAAVLLLAAGIAVWWFLKYAPVQVRTAYGTIQRVVLPDSSVVMLNGNSSLSWSPEWSTNQPREVWLEGEAFFDVTHQHRKGNACFRVHIGGATVEVLGTQFNVSQRGTDARIVLSSGKIKLNLTGKKESVFMKPGEVLDLTRKSGKIGCRKVRPELYTAWRNRELIFDETPLSEIALIIESTYGPKVIFTQKELAAYRISGTIPSDSVGMLLEALAVSSDLQIKKESNTILISKSK
jgi:ferric-dicitrate binding protein FerR (iron transport regulator)